MLIKLSLCRNERRVIRQVCLTSLAARDLTGPFFWSIFWTSSWSEHAFLFLLFFGSGLGRKFSLLLLFGSGR